VDNSAKSGGIFVDKRQVIKVSARGGAAGNIRQLRTASCPADIPSRSRLVSPQPPRLMTRSPGR